MMFAAAVGHRSGRATPSLRGAPQRQSMEIVRRETIYRNRNAVQTNPATSVFGLAFSQQSSAAGIMVTGALIAFSNTVMAYSFHAYQSELYPTRIRARAVGFTYSWSRVSTVFVGFMIAWCLRNYGTIGVFSFVASAMFMVFLIIAILGPRTTGLRLEAISR
jgi:MFS transporter, putative metabolite:H+ symporter